MADRNTPPLTPAGFQVLLALAGGAAHGYAVMRFVEEISSGTVRLGPGTLYRTLQRLVADGLVKEVEVASETPDPHDARRRYYELTNLGRTAAAGEAELLSRLVAAATDAGLLGKRRTA
ncbi:PadR family transcriptional regulator [Kibdelosporangium phytohabitans]|uniref:PadR family transcriptional regulator n=1 Tax=Kibdelosporangium phytohabitans TaxID=860235 RepID=A0A0N9IDW1_9PSEU|nr:PadR family transcriptional regulator [Kibdelosporangium phytohabitans]ALG13528.1 PadR family transcriptional regulator [Kibdelosporangium phytohabitans]MBE1465386.1 DNA-binding PadR family transcriptional regulator [Kibdelosporangium phytohabitans]